MASEDPRSLISSLLTELKEVKPFLEEYIKKIDGTHTLLMMKTDMVKSRVQLTHQQLIHHLTQVEQDILQDLNKIKMEREKSLGTHKIILHQHLDQIKRSVHQTELLLEIGNEDKLNKDCDKVRQKLSELTKLPKAPMFDAFTVLDFVPVGNINQVLNKNHVGYIRPCLIRLQDIETSIDTGTTYKAYAGVDEIVEITVSGEHISEASKYLTASIVDHDGVKIESTLEDKKNGKFMLEFLPHRVGTMLIRICLYEQDIPGSPFNVVVKDIPSDDDEDDDDDDETNEEAKSSSKVGNKKESGKKKITKKKKVPTATLR